jgi:hypothetical protein
MGICRALISFPKTCQSCGVEFQCGSLCCWCGEIKLDAAVRRELKEKFTDCLCRACLESAAREHKVPQGAYRSV